ncbi:hypothetical protein [uncultured Fusobacterium sp.]|jgi:hypothetical protein|uniref:hypothetical protein n=1 Tax=uncultured Fusobacterium sp. TaxID=159267 RepID=UPI0025E0ED11|nr:hypothetical protein [uncultured Fusobacterium sp.]MCF2640732.1 hypothetical protein [Fusobacterium varium]
MKKMALIGMMLFVVGATSFARGHHHNNNCNYAPCGAPQHYNCVVDQNRPKVAPKTQKRRNPEAERVRLVIDEKRLEIRKELIKETPDWKKIERINTEIATEQAKERTVNMKSRFEARKNIEQQLQKNN